MLRFDERTHQGESNLRVASRYVSYFGYNNQRHQRSLYGIGYHGGADLYQFVISCIKKITPDMVRIPVSS